MLGIGTNLPIEVFKSLVPLVRCALVRHDTESWNISVEFSRVDDPTDPSGLT